MANNVDRASRLIDDLRAAGATEFCICAGSRNSPLLVVAGAREDLRTYSFVDERSAAFFAIGRSKFHGAPVGVLTTSGTAAAELLPATIEAYYSGIPLILITADRPPRFRGTGAPQSIEQEGIFGPYAETSLEQWSGTRPLHLNIAFDEPLIDGAPSSPSCTPPLASSRTRLSKSDPTMPGSRPLVLVGGLAARHREAVRLFLRKLGAPVFAEALSGLREDSELPIITAGERMIARAVFDSVVRIGNVPTLRFWRDLEESSTPVLHFSDLPFAGLTRGEVHSLESLPLVDPVVQDDGFFALDREQAARFTEILNDEPRSELAMIRTLSRQLPPRSRVYLGNSLPIREWDLAAIREPVGFEYEANRGANGIDGQVLTFLGWCAPDRDNVCVVGDLTAIYDLNAPWIVPQLEGVKLRVVVVNNGGGRIFSRVPSLGAMDPRARQRLIENVHEVRFGPWAEMWNIDVTELRPEEDASQRAWQRYDELWSLS